MGNVFLEVGEASVAHEIFVGGEGDKVSALALVTTRVCVLDGGKVDKPGELVVAVKLEERLKGWETSKLAGLRRFVDLGSLALEDHLVLLVARAERQECRELSRRRHGKITRVAKVVLCFGKRCAWDG